MTKRLFNVLIVSIFLLFTSAVHSGTKQEVSIKADALLKKMTLQEKIGQMIQIDKMYLEDDSDIQTYFIGSILCGGDSFPEDQTAAGWAKMADGYQSIALKTRLAVPLIFGIDAVHGDAKVVDATIFPHNIGMGCTRDPALVEKAARITAKEMAATGFRWNFAPCIAVVRDERWGRTYEGYSEDPELVSIMGAAFVRGLQGKDLSAKDSVVSGVKHYLADGGTESGKNEGNASGSEDQLRKLFLAPYIAAVSNGAGTVMVSFSSWNGTKMHANRRLITDVLKNELKFDGFVVSDWAAVQRLPGAFPDQLTTAINAGIDMVMLPKEYKKFVETMTVLVQNGSISQSRIDDAVRRILKVKMEMGLFENPYSNKKLLQQVGSAENRKVARQCVRESVVLLKNEKGILPLSRKMKKIIVAGNYGDSVDIQCGGWTVYWQGGSGKVVGGTTVLNAIKKAVSPGTKVIFTPDGQEIDPKADVAIVITGEYPYAESAGDKTDLSLDADDINTINSIVEKKIPVVVVLISGRPLIVTKELPKWNAFLAAWLPGPEAGGIADVIFGDYDPTGKLSMTWPKDMAQIPVNIGDKNYKPLFEYGFGLNYKKKKK